MTYPFASESPHFVVCAECRYAQLYAEEPRARCMCPANKLAKDLVFAGQPACAWMTPRDEDDPTLAWCAPGLKTARALPAAATARPLTRDD